MKKKYVLHPGYIQSINDGDIHYTSAPKLAESEQREPSFISAPNRSKFDNSFSARVMYLYSLIVGKDKQKK